MRPDSTSITHKVLESSREKWVDRLKGWSILLVVIGHNVSLASLLQEGVATIYLFHVPLFFVITGLTLRPGMTLPQLLERALSLIWVYLGIGSIFLLWDAVTSRGDIHVIASAISGLIYGSGLTIRPVPIWFLPCLALSLPLAFLSLKATSRVTPGYQLATRGLLIAAWCALGSIALSQQSGTLIHRLAWGDVPEAGWFWSADIALIGAGYLLAGVLLKDILGLLGQSGALRLGLAAGGLFGSVLLAGRPTVDLNLRIFDPALPALIASFSGAIAVIGLARAADALPFDDLFVTIGQAALPILAFHNPIQRAISQFGHGQDPLWTGLAGVALAVSIPVLLNTFVLTRTAAGRWIFYPRAAFKSLRKDLRAGALS